ncbi:MAG: hypothetical protein HQL58_04290 [Magnetococcales bacterium]|nr:hypothetical protein [Magnetococcales bacterium]
MSRILWIVMVVLMAHGTAVADATQPQQQPIKVPRPEKPGWSAQPGKPPTMADAEWCPCSEARNCYGPKGGQYCHTDYNTTRYRSQDRDKQGGKPW